MLDALNFEGMSTNFQSCVCFGRGADREWRAIQGALQDSLRIIHREGEGGTGTRRGGGRPIVDSYNRWSHVADFPAVFRWGRVHISTCTSGLHLEVMGTEGQSGIGDRRGAGCECIRVESTSESDALLI